MTAALDTNIFIYTHFPQFKQHKVVSVHLKNLIASQEPFYLTWQVYYEFLRLVTHPGSFAQNIPLQTAHEILAPYLELEQCIILTETHSHKETIAELIKGLPSEKGNFVHDCHYAAILKENGIKKIITCDTDFKKFDFLKVINPLTM